MNDLALNPATTALLLMDLQPGILGRLPDSDAFLAGLVRARDAARAAGMTVGYVRVAISAEEAATIPARSRFARAGERLDPDRPETQIDPRIAPADGEIVVRKKRVGAFGTTDLQEQLDARGVDTLVLAGVSTGEVVLSTVRDAADRDYRLVVLEDGCWDSDPEVHQVLTAKVFARGGATVTSIDDFIASLA
ncbi:isochorismatase family cysteine hydrolase [Leifsonia shinshuensis]|uniref:Nicotinamidase-related amidase n=1 Tax=Leifsonia shinshuensis TaxID=150026 RepID=A0A853CSG1_9MICO|nr:nicotinamidase-related amidase [Leifsonia shinshuensis]